MSEQLKGWLQLWHKDRDKFGTGSSPKMLLHLMDARFETAILMADRDATYRAVCRQHANA